MARISASTTVSCVNHSPPCAFFSRIWEEHVVTIVSCSKQTADWHANRKCEQVDFPRTWNSQHGSLICLINEHLEASGLVYQDKATVSATDDVSCVEQGEGFQTVMPGSQTLPTNKVNARLSTKLNCWKQFKTLLRFGNIIIFDI